MPDSKTTLSRLVRLSVLFLFWPLVLVRSVPVIPIAIYAAAELAPIAADRCFLAEQCTCRNWHLLLQANKYNEPDKSGPRFVFDRSEFQFGTQCQLGRTPIQAPQVGGLIVGNGARTVFTGVTGFSQYLMYSDDGKHFLGCNAIFDYDNPYWYFGPADRFARLRLDGPGCNNPPLRGKSEYQQRYDVVIDLLASVEEASGRVLYAVYYDKTSASRDSNTEPSSLLLNTPAQTLCVNTTGVTWYDVTSGADELNYLVGHTYMSGTEAGQAARASYDNDGCTIVSTDIIRACVTETKVFSVPQAEYTYTAKATYDCEKGTALPEQTFSSILYNEYQ